MIIPHSDLNVKKIHKLCLTKPLPHDIIVRQIWGDVMTDSETRRVKRNKRNNAYQKANGYIAQKKYREAHKGSFYEPKIRIPSINKELLTSLLERENMSLSQLVSELVYEKYGINLLSRSDDADE